MRKSRVLSYQWINRRHEWIVCGYHVMTHEWDSQQLLILKTLKSSNSSAMTDSQWMVCSVSSQILY